MSYIKTFLFSICIQLSLFVVGQNNSDSVYENYLNVKLKEGQTPTDSLIAKRLLNDTLNFISYPKTSLLDSLIPNQALSYWELNLNIEESSYQNLYKSNKGLNELNNDSNVLTKTTSGFGTVCPPGGCNWYISGILKNGKYVTVANWKELSNFIGKIDNQFDAYLWLTCFTYGDSRSIPLNVSEFSRFKVLDDGYLIIVNLRVNDCPVTSANILYFVRKDKNVTFIQLLGTTVNGDCI